MHGMEYELRLYMDQMAPQAVVQMPLNSAPVRAIYVVSGSLRLGSGGATATLGANSGWHNRGAVRAGAGYLANLALRWELAAHDSPDAALAGGGVTSSLLNTAKLTLDPELAYLLRCDRVDFPPGGEALLHTHAGGGIRCLLFGAIEIETKGKRTPYGLLASWFESGPDPVYAAVSKTESTAFARVMILPRSLLGKSSISYVNAGDVAKPKSQQYQVFIDAPVELPL